MVRPVFRRGALPPCTPHQEATASWTAISSTPKAEGAEVPPPPSAFKLMGSKGPLPLGGRGAGRAEPSLRDDQA